MLVSFEEISRETWIKFNQSREVELRNVILTRYLHLVKEIAMRLVPVYKNHFDYDDLYSCGIFGLMDAIEKFDVDKGVKFETYAHRRIKGAIIDQIRKQDWIPKSMRQRFKSIEEAFAELERVQDRLPTDDEVAAYLNITMKDYNNILNDTYFYQIVSIDEQIMENLEYGGTSPETPEEHCVRHEIHKTLCDTIDQLTENERTVISLYYFDGLNQKEISKVLSITESRVSQLHSKALLKLRTKLSALKVSIF